MSTTAHECPAGQTCVGSCGFDCDVGVCQ
jgi:hypothetical protein